MAGTSTSRGPWQMQLNPQQIICAQYVENEYKNLPFSFTTRSLLHKLCCPGNRSRSGGYCSAYASPLVTRSSIHGCTSCSAGRSSRESTLASTGPGAPPCRGTHLSVTPSAGLPALQIRAPWTDGQRTDSSITAGWIWGFSGVASTHPRSHPER